MSTPGTQPELTDRQVKHLEFIQSVISRLSTDSFLMKGWAVTVAGVIFGFAADHKDWGVALAGLVPVACFWFLDVYFVRKERQFRTLYDEVRKQRPTIPSFSMDVALVDKKKAYAWWRVAQSVTLLPFYGFLAVVGVVIAISVAATNHHSKPTQAPRTKSATSSFTVSDHASLGGQILPM
jgi:hypothetical protein